jgi:hypothetical protein
LSWRVLAAAGALVVGCMKTPPMPAYAGRAEVVLASAELSKPDGTACLVEVETLRWGGRVLSTAELPEGDAWCPTSGEIAHLVEIAATDGPLVSARLEDQGCCPPDIRSRCATFDARTGREISLDEYDARRAERRWRRAGQLVAKRLPGVTLDRAEFWIGGGHVTFCGRRDGALVPVRVL